MYAYSKCCVKYPKGVNIVLDNGKGNLKTHIQYKYTQKRIQITAPYFAAQNLLFFCK